MNERKPNPNPRDPKKAGRDDRRARLADALRANLRRRKAQASARKDPGDPPDGEEPPPDE